MVIFVKSSKIFHEINRSVYSAHTGCTLSLENTSFQTRTIGQQLHFYATCSGLMAQNRESGLLIELVRCGIVRTISDKKLNP
jgi:hypothetical protein